MRGIAGGRYISQNTKVHVLFKAGKIYMTDNGKPLQRF